MIAVPRSIEEGEAAKMAARQGFGDLRASGKGDQVSRMVVVIGDPGPTRTYFFRPEELL